MHSLCSRLLGITLGFALALGLTLAAEPPAGEAVTVIDPAGKEIKLTGVKFTTGVRRLSWLGEASAPTEDGKKGPWALEIREPNSTTYQKGVITLVPLPSVENMKYDYDKFTASVAVKGLKDPLVGTCKYKGFCFLNLEGDVGGVKAKLSGGELKKGFKSLEFPAAKPLPPRAAESLQWSVQLEGAKPEDAPLVVKNLKPYYQLAGSVEQLADSLPVRKGEPIIFSDAKKAPNFKRLEVLAVDPNKKALVLEVDSGERTAVVLTGEIDKKPATLAGFIGEVDAGWKYFPLHTIHDLKPDMK